MEKNGIIKIAIIGAESTGKSTLVKELAAHFNTTYVEEYAREYFNTHNIDDYSIEVFDHIYSRQIENENEKMKSAHRFLFCDTTLITGKIWSEEVFGKTAEFIAEHLPKNNYDLYLVTENDLPWIADGQRKNPHNRNELQIKNIELLKELNATYALVGGFHEKRLQNAVEIILKHFALT